LIYIPSCKYWVISPDTILPLHCNLRCTLRVANTECFCLILYYPFCFNWIVVRVAIDVYFELQILSASVWYCTTPSVAIGQWFKLQLIYTLSCKYYVLPPDTKPFSCNPTVVRVAVDIHSVLQILSATADTVLPLQLQPDSGSSCNWYTLWVVNTKCFYLILYYPFSCNLTVVQVATRLLSQLQLEDATTCNYDWTCMIV
jgi:hypothetical protein